VADHQGQPHRHVVRGVDRAFAGIARISTNPFFRWAAHLREIMPRLAAARSDLHLVFRPGNPHHSIWPVRHRPRYRPLWYGWPPWRRLPALTCRNCAAGIQSIHPRPERSRPLPGDELRPGHGPCDLPQAIRRILPPLAGEFISLIKDSSLLGIIAIREFDQGPRAKWSQRASRPSSVVHLRPAVFDADLHAVSSA